MIVIGTRRLAREWLWFVGTFLIVFSLCVWLAIMGDASGNTSGAFNEFWLALLLLYGLVSFVRMTVWAVKNRNTF